MAITYDNYLKVSVLTNLQTPLSPGQDHDETLFIIAHQVYELWFKQLLHELNYLIACFNDNQSAQSLNTLKRILTVFRTLIQQVDIIETMSPLSFLSFRGRLESASGFQSAQFRAVESLLGLKDTSKLSQFPEQSPQRALLEETNSNITVWDAFLKLLNENGHPIPEAILKRNVEENYCENVDVQRALIEVYKTDTVMMQICEYFIDIDASLQEWRYRHVQMVERTIGNKIGTGGSSGVNYLKSTLSKKCFPDLWAIRTDF